jgi:hypothetical protein
VYQPTNGQLPLITLLKKPAPVEPSIVASFGEDEEIAVTNAIAWAWRERRVKPMTQRGAAELLSMKAPHFCNVLSGKKYLPLHKLNAYEELVGNTAVTQTIARFAALRESRLQHELAGLVAEHLAKTA